MPVTIIAEAGVNHNGSLEMAKEMARVAKECGALKYWMPMESQYSFNSLCASNEKCSLRIISSWLSAASVVCF